MLEANLKSSPSDLPHAWKRLVVRRGSWRCVTDTGCMRTPSTYGSVGMGQYGHGPSKRKLPTSHCASTWRLCEIINSWPLRNFLVETRETWRCRLADLFRFGITWYHYISITPAMGTVFHPPQPARATDGYRSFNAMVRCWVPAVKTHGKIFRFHTVGSTLFTVSFPLAWLHLSLSQVGRKMIVTVVTLHFIMFKRTKTNWCRAPV